jgi:hypothetical protein
MGYYNNYLVDNHSCIIVGVQATGARLSEESRAAEEMITRFTRWQGKTPQSIGADASYGNGELLQFLMDRQITPYMPTRDAVARTRSPLFGPERFTYQPESNSLSFAKTRSGVTSARELDHCKRYLSGFGVPDRAGVRWWTRKIVQEFTPQNRE